MVTNNEDIQEHDDAFVNIYYEAVKKQFSNAVMPFFLFITYLSSRLIFRGNAIIYYLSYREILYCSIGSILMVFIYSVTNLNNLDKQISMKKFLIAGLEGFSRGICFIVWFFYIYCIIFVGIYSLWNFRYGFSIFPIIKVLLFSGFGLHGLRALSHLLIIGKMLSKRESKSNIVAYLEKYKIFKRG